MILDGVLDMIRAFHFGHIKAEQAWHDAAEKSACNAGVEKWSTILDAMEPVIQSCWTADDNTAEAAFAALKAQCAKCRGPRLELERSI
jgi:hypothetical protein